MPRGLGGSRWRPNPSAAEARAALEVLKGLTTAGGGGAGGDDKASLEYLTVRMDHDRGPGRWAELFGMHKIPRIQGAWCKGHYKAP